MLNKLVNFAPKKHLLESFLLNNKPNPVSNNANVIKQLAKEILPLQGLKTLSTDTYVSLDFDPIESSFPNTAFPIGCMHEFLSSTQQGNASTVGFIAALLNKLMSFQGTAIWISTSRTIFPFALHTFGIQPEQIIFIDLKSEKDVLYATEEALKCTSITSVISEIKNISFTESRRFQLAAEQSRVSGFLIRHQPRSFNPIACISRWRITSLQSELNNGMPGVGFPRWNVELLKVRNGKPGTWKIEYASNRFNKIKENVISIKQIPQRKII